MKSMAGGAGNYNLRGKRSMVAHCGCCDIIDLRDKERVREARNLINREIIGFGRTCTDEDCSYGCCMDDFCF